MSHRNLPFLPKCSLQVKPEFRDTFIEDWAFHSNGHVVEEYWDFYNATDLNDLPYDMLYVFAGHLSCRGYRYYLPQLIAAAFTSKDRISDATWALEAAVSVRTNRNSKKLREIKQYLGLLSKIEQNMLVDCLIDLSAKFRDPVFEHETQIFMTYIEATQFGE